MAKERNGTTKPNGLAAAGTASELTFEQSLGELESLVRKLEDGQLDMDEALAAYEQAANAPAFGRLGQTSFTLPRTYQRLGELYEERGDRAKALEYYNRLLDLWKDADPELQPVVRDVRARVGRLAQER